MACLPEEQVGITTCYKQVIVSGSGSFQVVDEVAFLEK